VRFNFEALFALSALVLIWSLFSPIWLPLVSWAVSFLLPVFWFVGKVLLALGSLLVLGLAVVAISVLLGGTIPSTRGF